MFSTSFRSFLQDESGAYAIWSLVWFSIYVAMGGLAVDMTDAYRNQTLLQATADASALAGVMSLPAPDEVVAEALAYSTDNMDPGTNGNGNVLKAEDVILGNWSFDTDTFTTGGIAPNAVLAITRRSVDNDNALATSFLRIINLWGIQGDVWTINTEAIAVKYVPDCLRGGLVSYNAINITSRNIFRNEMCLHAQNETHDTREQDYAISLNDGNTINPGVTVSMPRLDEMDGRPNIYDKNGGLADAMREGDLWPKDAMQVNDIVDSLVALETKYMPPYVLEADGTILQDTVVDGIITAEGTVVRADENTFPDIFQENIANNIENKIYLVECSSSNKIIKLPSGVTIRNVAIITTCNIHASNAAAVENALIASSALGNGQDETDPNAISIASDANIGSADYCDSGGVGGVEIYAKASAHIAAKLDVNGLRAVVGGDFQLSAGSDVEGVSVEAMDRLTATAGGDFALCANGTVPPGVFAWHYRLVR